MKSLRDLKYQGLEFCQEHAARRIKGDLLVESVSERLSWDPVELRHVFDQLLVIWRKVGSFEVILDSLGRMAGFVDHGKYASAKDGALAPEDADALVAASGVVPGGAKRTELKERKMPSGARIFRGRYELRYPLPDYEAVEVDFNPTNKEIIAIRPIPRRR
jgi:hypothetical protein